MKPQDLLFFAVLIVLILLKKPRWLVAGGLVCLLVSIPLFASWIFFTAQRLTWYAAGFFLTSLIFYTLILRRHEQG